MLTTIVCIPDAQSVPGFSGPPDWLGLGPNPSTKLDDPNWRGALQFSHGPGTREQATFRALFSYDGSPAVPYLYLSWLARVDPDGLSALTLDSLHLGFNNGQQAAVIRFTIGGEGIVEAQSNYTVAVFIWDATNKTWNTTSPVTQNPFGWINDTRVWTRQPFDNTPTPVVQNAATNQVPWAFQLRVPLGEIIPATLPNNTPTPGGAISISNQFKMWYALSVKVDDTTDPHNPKLIQYTWPEDPSSGNAYDVQIDESLGFLRENKFPDPFSTTTPWGTVNANNLDANCKGVDIQLSSVGTNNSPTSKILTQSTDINTFFADPLNRTGAPLAANVLQARFRIANWGSQNVSSPLWSDIRGGEAVKGDALTIPNGNQGGPVDVNGNPILGPDGKPTHFIHFPWTLNTTEASNYQPPHDHQCMLVELSLAQQPPSPPLPDIIFMEDSVVHNMDFSPTSFFSREAEVSINGLKPISPDGRDVYLYVELANLPSLVTTGGVMEIKALPTTHSATGTVDAGGFDKTFLTNPTYLVHAYHDTGRKMLVGGVPHTILHAQTSFGYFLQHDGPLFGWDNTLEGAVLIAPNFYKLEKVPNDKPVQVTTTVEALEQPRGARNSGFMVQSTSGTQGNFELVVPHANEGLVHCTRNNDAQGLPWGGSTVFGKEVGHVDAVSLIQSNFGTPGNLEVIARVGQQLLYFWYEYGPTPSWHGPVKLQSGVSGNPALIQGRFGKRGNFEFVVPRTAKGIIHYWRNNDVNPPVWEGGTVFGEELGHVDAVALLQSNIGNHSLGHLEVIARVGEDLFHLWRDSGPVFKWSDPLKFYSGATGIPGFIQSNFGGKGNFEVVTPSIRGGMVHLDRNNDEPATFPWHVVTSFDSGNVTAVSLLQSNFTMSSNASFPGPGDFEVAARIGNRTAHYWRRDLPPLTWTGPTAYACS